jgi:membrane-bound lytic murein transglycosylase MltF
MTIPLTAAALCLGLATVAAARTTPPPKPVASSPAQAAPNPAPPRVEDMLARKKWTGDFDGMLQRRVIRALVPHSRTMYFVEKGQPHGLAYEALKAFEDEINKTYNKGKLKVHVLMTPTSREDLIPALLDGRGDLAVAGLTITPGRQAQVDFGLPSVTNLISEIVVTGPKSPKLASIDDLAGREVFVRKSSSYWEHLELLNQRFAKEGKPAVKLRPAPEDLEDEDLLEMLSAGLFGITVVDDYKAALWAKVLPQIVLHRDIAVNSGGELAWAFRQNSPKLKAAVDAFAKTHRQGTAFGNTVIRKYLGSTQFVKSATADEEMKRFRALGQLFRKYGEKYSMDYLLMMAQGFQESRLDHAARSQVGAIGVMQVMPATGKDMKVGDIAQLEPNIHAGVKYIRFMIDQYYKNEQMDPVVKGLFAFASYNAGPGRIRQLRRETAARGLDPNRWFNHVEVLAAEKIGAETVTYVSNIFKYYVAYRLIVEDERQKATSRATVGPPSP